tara:strand:+ start:1596 stop:2063 length:468 start_codon:yes stop_codon:yes gene_type:complete
MGQRVQGTLNKLSKQLIDDMINEIVSKNKVASGDLRDSFLGLVSEDELKIFNGAEYASNVDLGRRPGKFPNINKLQSWIKIKFGNGPYESRGGKPLKLKDLTYVIGRKIARDGWVGINYSAKALLNAEQIITKELGDAYLFDLEEQLEKQIPNLK